LLLSVKLSLTSLLRIMGSSFLNEVEDSACISIKHELPLNPRKVGGIKPIAVNAAVYAKPDPSIT
jgi:hypothetical protein